MSDPVLAAPTDGGGGDPIPELLRLGEQLARAREGAGLSQEVLAQTLKVEPRLLRSLEAGDHSRLPEGVFVVALARRIAGALHADVDDAISGVRQSRLMEHRPSGTPPVALAAAAARRPPRPSVAPSASARPATAPRHRPDLPWRWPLAALLAAAGATACWLLLSRPQGGSLPTPTETSQPPVAAPEPTKAPTTPPPPAAAADTLRLRASEPSWLQVRDSQGRTVFEGTLTGEKSFALGTGLEVLAGRPYAVTAAIGPAAATPLGGVDDIRWKRFTPGGPASSSPAP